jgi:hypothetical protein
MININLAPLKSAKQFTKNVASALQQANKAKRTPEMIKNLISEGNTIGNTQRQVLKRGAEIVDNSKERGLSLNLFSNSKANLTKLQNTTGVLPEVAGLSQNTILGKTNTKRLGNTIKAYENLQNAQQESTTALNGKKLKQGSANLLQRELSKAGKSNFEDLSPEAKSRVLRSDDILSGNPVQIKKSEKMIEREQAEKIKRDI